MTQSFLKDRFNRKTLISVGSNASHDICDATELLRECVKALRIGLGSDVESSMYYRTPAFPEGAGPDYANAVFVAQTDLIPEQIIALLHNIEADAGRTRTKRWGQRTLDLDIIACGDVIMPSIGVWTHWRELPLNRQMQETPQELILPHPRVQDRAFVLVPLAEVAPDWIHPVTGQSVQAMLAALSPAEIASVKPLG